MIFHTDDSCLNSLSGIKKPRGRGRARASARPQVLSASVLILFLICSSFGPTIQAQDPRGTIVGRIADATGGVVPGVTVEAKNLATNVTASTITNDVGLYELPYLLPGFYEIKSELAGFKTRVRTGIGLRTGDRIAVDFVLDVGEPSDVVRVTAETPVLETTNANLAEVVSPRQISELPLRAGSVSWMWNMAPGTMLQNLTSDGPWNVTQAAMITVGGAGGGAFDHSIDGVSNNAYGGVPAFVPPPDMVQEVRIQTTTYDAQMGHTSAGSINISMKSGTNALHGTLGFSAADGPMFTRDFFVNQTLFNPATGEITPEKIAAATPANRWIRSTASVGGPVYLPGLYDGRDKTFWMFGWQSHNRTRAVSSAWTVPTAKMRNGDFSELLALGSNYQIYDPATTVPAGTRVQRQPFAGNIIPSNRIDPIARKIVSYYPEPNAIGSTDFTNNYRPPQQDQQDLYQPIVRVDHNFSENWRMFVRYSHSDFQAALDQVTPGSDVRGRLQQRPHRGVALDNVLVLSPQMVLDVRYGFERFKEYRTYANMGWNLSEFGFPSELISQLDSQAITFPNIAVNGMLPLGNDGGNTQKYYQHTLLSVLSLTRKKHSLKTGLDGRLILENAANYGYVSPRMVFAETYTRGPYNNSPVAPAGQGLASFLLGIPTGGWSDVNDNRAESSRFYGLFIQDDWRVSSNLTLNLGLRWEYESPQTERFNRTSRQFDFVTPNPVEAGVQANYALNPIPEIPVGQFRTLGGLTFAGINGNSRQVRDPYYRAFMPRVGFAYRFKSDMVLRGGYGIFYGLIGSEWTNALQPGYSAQTSIISSNDNGQTYIASISNPLPNGLLRPAGSSGGMTTFLGQAPGFFAEDGRRPYAQRWSLNVQWSLSPVDVIEIGYTGSRSVRDRVSTQFNPVPGEYWSTSPNRDQATIDFMGALFPNPFRGIAAFQGSALYTNVRSARAQLLRPYPHFGNLITDMPAGSSWFHAGTARYERRFAKGLQMSANYTWSKTMDASSYLNVFDPIPEHVISDQDRAHRFVANGLYELPFGRGKFLGGSVPGWLNHIVGGWQTQAVFVYQSGPPLGFGNVIFTGNSFDDLKLPDGEKSLDHWFNTDVFDRNSANQLSYNIRTLSSRQAKVRAPGTNVWDLSMMKSFRLREGMKLQLRCDAEGALNHPTFRAPIVNPYNSLFGKITTSMLMTGDRVIFVGTKLVF